MARSCVLVWLCCVLAFACGQGVDAQPTRVVWVGSWAASQQIPEPANTLPAQNLAGATLRQIVRLSVGGSVVRVHISNVFGTEPLEFASVHIARAASPASSQIVSGSDRTLLFAGAPTVTVPAGAEYISDPLPFPVAPLSNLAVTMYLPAAPARETGHPGSRSTSYYLPGDHVADAELTGAGHVDHWYQLSGIDVEAQAGASAVVALGDSITDGHATTTNGNNRWTDVLAERLQANAATRNFGVLNQGIGGNHLLTDGLGPNVLARFDRDVLAQAGVRSVILLEGVNDLGGLSRMGTGTPAQNQALVTAIIASYEQIVTRAHAAGIRVFGGTVMPFDGSDYYHPDAAIDADLSQINAWIRVPGHFDAVIDFAKVMADPAHPGQLRPAYDSGDHLHPNPAGYKAMGDAVPLALLSR